MRAIQGLGFAAPGQYWAASDLPPNLSHCGHEMTLKELAGNVVTGVLVVCALTLTILVVRRELSAGDAVNEPPPIEDWQALLEGAPTVGTQDAKLRLIEFMDYQCPCCVRMQPLLDSVLSEREGELQLVIRHMPLADHPQAIQAAVFAECASAEGRFPEAHRELLTQQGMVAAMEWDSLASRIGLGGSERFAGCLRDSSVTRKVLDDAATAVFLGVKYTPTFLVGQRWATGAQTRRELDRLLRH